MESYAWCHKGTTGTSGNGATGNLQGVPDGILYAGATGIPTSGAAGTAVVVAIGIMHTTLTGFPSLGCLHHPYSSKRS